MSPNEKMTNKSVLVKLFRSRNMLIGVCCININIKLSCHFQIGSSIFDFLQKIGSILYDTLHVITTL